MNTRYLFFLLLILAFSVQVAKAQDMPREEQPPPEERVVEPEEQTVELEESAVEPDEQAVEPERGAVKTEKRTVEEGITNTYPVLQALADSVAASKKNKNTEVKEAWKPNPKRALWLSMVPGLGQIYNRKYWKLPIVYGGFMGCMYAVTWNNRQYTDYKEAYLQFKTDPDNPNPLWHNFVAPGTNPETVNLGTVERLLKTNKDNFRRYRDLSIIVTALVYLLSILDAYVDAQLYDFDISPDLGMRIEPAMFERTTGNSRSYGVQCNIKF